MKVTPRFIVRAGLVLSAAGALGAFGACGKDSGTNPPPPPPPPPPPVLAAPTEVVATPNSQTQITLGWKDNTTIESGFRVDRCSGANCTNFAQVGVNTAANIVTFVDTGLTASTSYSYRVRAFNATDTSAWSGTVSATTLAVVATPGFVMVGAGEITTCASTAGPMGTAHIIDSILRADPEASAFTVGNNLADEGAGTTFQSCFEPKWGSFKSRTYYAIGNGDFHGGRGVSGVYAYFGDRTGPANKGWFSFDKGNWHIVVLNTSDWEHGAAATFGIDAQLNRVPSEQVDWLTADLAANTKPCVMAISWERRMYTTSSGTAGRNSNMLPMGNILYDNGVDLLVSAKDKLYARFAPVNPRDGSLDPDRGLRQFIVGTGGRSFDQARSEPLAVREAQIANQWGVLKLTLKDGSYDYEFIPTTPGGPTDKGTVACH